MPSTLSRSKLTYLDQCEDLIGCTVRKILNYKAKDRIDPSNPSRWHKNVGDIVEALLITSRIWKMSTCKPILFFACVWVVDKSFLFFWHRYYFFLVLLAVVGQRDWCFHAKLTPPRHLCRWWAGDQSDGWSKYTFYFFLLSLPFNKTGICVLLFEVFGFLLILLCLDSSISLKCRIISIASTVNSSDSISDSMSLQQNGAFLKFKQARSEL